MIMTIPQAAQRERFEKIKPKKRNLTGSNISTSTYVPKYVFLLACFGKLGGAASS